jgi:signal transduction histidine kinase
MPFSRGGEEFVLLTAVRTSEAERSLKGFQRVTLFLLPCSIFLTALISTWYVGRILKPIALLTDHASRMSKRVSDPQQKRDWHPLPAANSRDELGRLAETFNELLARVDSALTQLQQFVSDASHELRTPLSVLQVETELLLSDARLPEEDRKSAHVIHDEVKKLNRIIAGLFTLAMADAGQLRLEAEPLYLNEVLEDACIMAEQPAKSKDIVIVRQLGEEIPYFGDEAFLQDLFLIFLENAIKYSPRATRVSVEMCRWDGKILVKFKDQGIGIDSQHLPHIFERFYRAVQNNGTDARSGGLGLAIAQVIVSAQNGSIQCETTPGKGSTFTVGLPLPSPSV